MKPVKLAAAILNQTPLDWDGNKANILQAIEQAREDDVAVLCLPEMCIPGYGCEDAFLSPAVQEMSWRVLHELLPATTGMAVSFGLPMLYQNALFNTACMVVDGKIAGFVAKQFLAGDGLHYEPRWFKPWPSGVNVQAPLFGEQSFPFGDVFFEIGGLRIGFEICEDAWVATRPGGSLALRGVDIILNPSASHFAFGKGEVRKRFVLEGSRAFGVSYVYANLLGNEAGRAIYDGGAMIASGGHLVAAGPRFSWKNVVVTSAIVDVTLTRAAQSRTGSFKPRLLEDSDDCIRVDFDIPAAAAPPMRTTVDAKTWERSPNLKYEEFTRAIALALMDYLRKSRSSGFVVSLSGGVDSAACAVLVAYAVRMGTAELGLTEFIQRERLTSTATSPAELTQQLLLTAYQATINSGEITSSAARKVAQAISANHLELDIESIASAYVQMISSALGRPLTWRQDDIALQNIQARVRSPGIWMLANIRNALLLSTSNRSEAAVGYATMDGDTSGSISPIAGIDKHFLRQWMRWMESEGPAGFGPIPALSAINAQQPTAELRPPGAAQTDEKDLMPYDVLDSIERAAIRDKRGPLEVYELTRQSFPHYTVAEIHLWVERFFRLWCRNQWKRERYAPSFHVDDENLDPKTWCRFPILSGGFERELRELREQLAKTSGVPT